MNELLALLPKDWTEEATLITDDAARVLRVLEGGLALRILERPDAVLLVEGHAGKREHRQSDIVCALGWQEVSVMPAAEFFDERNPDLPVMLEFLELERVDDVSQIAGNHGVSQEIKPARGAGLAWMNHYDAVGPLAPRIARIAWLTNQPDRYSATSVSEPMTE